MFLNIRLKGRYGMGCLTFCLKNKFHTWGIYSYSICEYMRAFITKMN